MKKIYLVLLLAALGKNLPAQTFYINAKPLSEDLFGLPAPNSLRSRFDFFLPANNRLTIEIYSIQQIDQLPDLDSLFKKIWADLQPLRDSLSDPLTIRRVDYLTSSVDTKIRIRQHTPGDNYFSYKDDELVQMKVDQDTVRFKGYIPEVKNEKYPRIHTAYPYSIMLLVNNISDIATFPPGLLNSSLDLLKKDWETARKKGASKNVFISYAAYDVNRKKRMSPVNFTLRSYGTTHGVQPYVQLGVQYARGAWIPSAGAGFEYYYGKNNYGEYSVQLIWEPYFFFQRDEKNKLLTQRNDFITLRFHNDYKTKDPLSNRFNVEFTQNFSVGYLINKQGSWFQKNTVKFTLPGLQTRNVLLEPEFLFSKFFQHFNPSLKLTLYFE